MNTPQRTDPPVHAVLLFVQVSFGTFHVVARAVLEHLEPLALAGLRLGLATPLLLLLAWRHDRLIPTRRELPTLMLLGFLGVFANQILFLMGLNWTTATNAGILMPAVPVFAAALGALLGIDRIGPRRLGGIALAVAGALVILDPSRFSLGDRQTLGNLLILANALCYGAFLVVQRPVLARLPWRTVIAWSFLFGTLGVEAVALPSLQALEWTSVASGVWWGVAFIVIFPTVLGYSLNSWAIRRSSPTLVATYTTLQPLVTVLLAASFLGEELRWVHAVGCGLITAGLVLVSRPGRRSSA